MTPRPPLVSVVVPVFNGERFLGETLESVLAQTHRPLEVIVVNDGSTDRSGAIARSFPDVRYYEQRNTGVAAARNAGIESSHGEFVAFVDQDDLWLPDKVAAQVRVMMTDTSIDWCVSAHRRFVDPSTPRPSWIKPAWLDTPVVGPDPSTMLVRRSTLARVGVFDPAYLQAPDVDWAFRASEAGLTRAVVDEPLVLRRMHDANQSRFVASTHAEIRQIAIASIRRRREAGRA